ncbi:MAG TPA: glycosyltransferase family 2 protein [Ignavibacteria bacterium]|nr:glycosyltransferase family 2 protein [Ignavibacteria bacterium]
MKSKVSIILLNYNGAKDTIECIESLEKITYKNFEIIVVDNNSDENDKKLLEGAIKKENVSVIYNDSNLGFSGGNNIGINKAINGDSDFVLLLNNDTVVDPDFLEHLLEIFNKNKNSGIAAPQINYYDEPGKVWSEGGKVSKIRGSGFAYSERMDNNKNIDDTKVGFVSGCCMLIKNDVFEDVGLFDDNFFLYVEDTDFCFRTNQLGYKIYITHKSKIYHKVNQTTAKENLTLPIYYNTRNRLYFAKKHFGLIYYCVLTYLFFTFVVKCSFWIFTNQTQKVKVVIKAFSDFLKGKMGKTNI